MSSKKYFFGWGNIKKGITELIRIYSHKPSFFSKKRIESGVAFMIAQWGMVFFVLKKYSFERSTKGNCLEIVHPIKLIPKIISNVKNHQVV